MSQENATSLIMLFKLAISSSGKFDFIGDDILTAALLNLCISGRNKQVHLLCDGTTTGYHRIMIIAVLLWSGSILPGIFFNEVAPMFPMKWQYLVA